jgi:hypothetical protein
MSPVVYYVWENGQMKSPNFGLLESEARKYVNLYDAISGIADPSTALLYQMDGLLPVETIMKMVDGKCLARFYITLTP